MRRGGTAPHVDPARARPRSCIHLLPVIWMARQHLEATAGIKGTRALALNREGSFTYTRTHGLHGDHLRFLEASNSVVARSIQYWPRVRTSFDTMMQWSEYLFSRIEKLETLPPSVP